MSARKIAFLILIVLFAASVETAWNVREHVDIGPQGCRVMGGRFYGPSWSFEATGERPVTASALRLEVENAFGGVSVVEGAPGVVKVEAAQGGVPADRGEGAPARRSHRAQAHGRRRRREGRDQPRRARTPRRRRLRDAPRDRGAGRHRGAGPQRARPGRAHRRRGRGRHGLVRRRDAAARRRRRDARGAPRQRERRARRRPAAAHLAPRRRHARGCRRSRQARRCSTATSACARRVRSTWSSRTAS